MPSDPPRESGEPPLGVSRDRLVCQPVLEVLRQRANRVVSRGASLAMAFKQIASSGAGIERSTARGGGKSAASTFLITSEICSLQKASWPVRSSYMLAPRL